jgi:hypothetical protein
MTKLEIALAVWLLIQVPLGCLIGRFISVGAGGDPVLQEETDEAGMCVAYPAGTPGIAS